MAKAATNKEKKGQKEKDGKGGKILPTRAELDAAPLTIPVVIDGKSIIAEKRQFSTGSVGWRSNEKIPTVAGKYRCQVSVNVTIIGSKQVK